MPFIGGVTLSFLQSPAFDFDLGGVANALDLPGVGLLLRHVIQDQLEQTIVMPNSLSVALVPQDDPRVAAAALVESHAAVNPPLGVLSVHVVEARGLVNKDSALLGQGKSDPYAKVRIVADGVAHTFKTDAVDNCLDPQWRLLVDVPVDDPETLDDVGVEVWDEDRGSKDDFLGRCKVAATVARTAMAGGQTQDVWKPLEDVKRGSVHLEVSWSELKLTRPEGPQDEYHRGVLTVLVDSCRNLGGAGNTGMRLPNPSARLELCGILQATEPVVGSVNPVFAHRMSFLVRDPKSDTLKVTVTDEKKEGGEALGVLRFNISDLLEQTGLCMTNQQFLLTTRRARGERSPQVVLSLAFRFIHRPKTNSYGVHRSLQELHKIMQSTVDTPKSKDGMKFIDDDSSTATSPAVTLNRRDINGNHNPFSSPTSLNGSLLEPNPASRPGQANVHRSETLPIGGLRPSAIHKADPRPRLQLSLKYNKRTMILSVVVHRVKNLQVAHNNSASSLFPWPYVKLYTIETSGVGSNRRVSRSKRKTKSQKEKIAPVFEETLEYFLPPGDLRSRRLEVSVCSERGLLGRNVALGRCLVSLSPVHASIFAQQSPDALFSPSSSSSGHQPSESSTVTDWHVLHPTASRSPFHRSTAVTRSLASSRSTPSNVGERRGVAVSMGSGGARSSKSASRSSLNML